MSELFVLRAGKNEESEKLRNCETREKCADSRASRRDFAHEVVATFMKLSRAAQCFRPQALHDVGCDRIDLARRDARAHTPRRHASRMAGENAAAHGFAVIA